MTQPPKDAQPSPALSDEGATPPSADAPRGAEARPNPNRRDRLRGMARRIFSELEQDLGEEREGHGGEHPAEPKAGAARGDGHRGDGHRGDGHRGDGNKSDGHRGDGHKSEGARPEARSEARDLLWSLLETGDKAKTEIIKLVAREVRGYLEALELHKDLHHLLTNYSLEVKASVHLKPLAEELLQAPATGPGVSAQLRPLDRGDRGGRGGADAG